jgi:hypothetical protein
MQDKPERSTDKQKIYAENSANGVGTQKNIYFRMKTVSFRW